MRTEAWSDLGTSSEISRERASSFANPLQNALYKMIGIAGSRPLIARAVPRPFISGIETSNTIKSGPQLPSFVDCLFPVLCFTYLNPQFSDQQFAESTSDKGIVIDDQYSFGH
jgi:hypothetical protein